ncbi:hypothetical protein RvY_04245-5 [Ramazzottius varieornatus]|uniref:Uncharacterized protein n=1 Tax=Ramazzottius varieornatus TaxID=947166 RepID=A0A1D1UXV4_RAMVA|nr:hypothetical protein RvY_04245-5 [Ramazzottius varieornatus]
MKGYIHLDPDDAEILSINYKTGAASWKSLDQRASSSPAAESSAMTVCGERGKKITLARNRRAFCREVKAITAEKARSCSGGGPCRTLTATKSRRCLLFQLNPNQRRILEETRLLLKTEGFGKVELFPRSNVWVCGTRFKTFNSELHRNPLIDAVDLALLFFGPRHNALDLFEGRGFGLQAALGNGAVDKR